MCVVVICAVPASSAVVVAQKVARFYMSPSFAAR
jgi:hypothetical protein